MHSKLKNCIGKYQPLVNSLTDITLGNNFLWIAYNTHFIGIFKKSNEEAKISKYNKYDYDSDSDLDFHSDSGLDNDYDYENDDNDNDDNDNDENDNNDNDDNDNDNYDSDFH